MNAFRGRFLGKCSPVHFFWGSFDLAVTRFSGRTAPPLTSHSPNLGDWVMQEAYSHEVSSCGFWPGNGGFGEAAFYAYAYPEPAGFGEAPVPPPGAYNKDVGQFILPYEAVRTADAPDDDADAIPAEQLRGLRRQRQVGPARAGAAGAGEVNGHQASSAALIRRSMLIRVCRPRA